jgi:Ni,Fe-hydrogenase III large subunit
MKPPEAILRAAEREICRPWPRHVLSQPDWTALAQAAASRSWVLLAHWADATHAHALFLDPAALAVIPVSTPVDSGTFPALSPSLPAARWYERMIHDLWGHQPAAAVDLRPWLDHGRWPASPPMAARPEPRPPAEPPTFETPDDHPDAMVLPLGPVWGLHDEAAHLHLTLHGSAIHSAEALLGFTHKGTLALLRGKSPRAAARFAARLSADATVAHAVAFATAAESAADVTAPPRALGLRVVMMEIERIAGHLDNLAEVARLAGDQAVWTRCGFLRENTLRTSAAAFGHRLMMDCVIPGGIAADIIEGGAERILRTLGDLAADLPAIHRLNDTPSRASRLTGLGHADASLAAGFGVGGIVARASGHAYDLRTLFFAPGYRELAPRIAVHEAGDAAARQYLRLREIEESLRLISAVLEILPPGPVAVVLPQVSGEGIGCAESVRGDIWHWLQLDHGQIAAAFLRDPGWALWPLAEHILPQAQPDDIDLIRASLALPASGPDL